MFISLLLYFVVFLEEPKINIATTYPSCCLETHTKHGERLPIPPRGKSLAVFLVSIGRPFHMMFVEPLVFPAGLVLAVLNAILYSYYVAYTLLFQEVYHFTPYEVGMTFTPILVGTILALPCMSYFDKTVYQKSRAEAIASGNEVEPEKRLHASILGVTIMPVSMFW
jgi:hypothetical protein